MVDRAAAGAGNSCHSLGPMRGRGRVLLLVVAAIVGFAAPLRAATAGAGQPVLPVPPSAVIAIWGATPADNLVPGEYREPHDTVLRRIDGTGLTPGLLSASQGSYSRVQALLDISQGTRQPSSLHEPRLAPAVTARQSGSAGVVEGWADLVRRAQDVSVTLRPGLLAHSVPGGAGFVGVDGLTTDAAVAAADRAGQVADFSLGPPASVADRTADALERHQLVVVTLPPGRDGEAALDDLARDRRSNQLLVVAHLPPTPAPRGVGRAPTRFYALPALGVAGLGTDGSVTSETTRQDGLVSTIDLAPTILGHLGLAVPAVMRGEPVRQGPERSADDLEQQRRRWSDVRTGRQSSSVNTTMLLSLALFLLVGTLRGAKGALRQSLRVSGLALLWWPTTVLVAASLGPSTRFQETAIIAGVATAAAVLTDLLLPWPRGPLAPAAAGLLAYVADLATGGRLLTRSVLGPSILSGGRFYGISNELEPLLPILALAGLAAVAGSRRPSPRLRLLYAVTGVVLGLAVGWGQLGADVGGVITVAAAFAAAVLVVRDRPVTRRVVAIALAVPVLGLLALVAIDLAFGGGAHLSRNLTRSEGLADLAELVVRRYELMATTLGNTSTVLWVLGALLAVAFAYRNWSLFAGLLHLPQWRAALIGGVVGGVVGALTNDSGPVLLINAVLASLAVTAYGHGRVLAPDARGGSPPQPISALRRSEAPAVEPERAEADGVPQVLA